MKTVIRVGLVFLLSELCAPSSICGQIRSDFVLVPTGETPHIVLDDNGRLHAVWRDDNGGVKYGVFDPLGKAVGPSLAVDRGGLTVEPRLDVMKNYTVILYWSQIPGSNAQVFGSVLENQLDSVLVSFGYQPYCNDCGSPDLKYITDSTFISVWAGNGAETEFQGEGIHVLYMTNSRQILNGPKLVSDDLSPDWHYFSPRVAYNAFNHQGAVSWLAGVVPDFNVYLRAMTEEGTPVGPTILVNEESNISTAGRPDLTINNSGDMIVVWAAESTDSVWNIYQRRFNSKGVPFAASERVNEAPSLRFAAVDIALNEDDSYIVIWEGGLNPKTRILGQRFSSNGSKIGGNFVISTQPDSAYHAWPSGALRNDTLYTVWSAGDTSTEFSLWANILDFRSPVVTVEESPEATVVDFDLLQNYPNPFNSSTLISYIVAREAHVRISVHNILGQEVAVLKDEVVVPGAYTIRWDGKDRGGKEVTSGIYVYHAQIGNVAYDKRMLLIR